jgi:hypothetical protein
VFREEDFCEGFFPVNSCQKFNKLVFSVEGPRIPAFVGDHFSAMQLLGWNLHEQIID